MLLEQVLKTTTFHPILKEEATDFVWMDLSKTNEALLSVDVTNATKFSEYITQYLRTHKAQVAIGGYNEYRNIYQRSTIFKNQEVEERFIHLGLDLWAKAYTPIYAPAKGKIHSFNNNEGLGNYGPTIVLEHQIKGQTFYTLYGHLTKDSIANIVVGESIDKGEMFAAIGNYPSNGDYPPHLHFQVIKNMNGMQGDFPGVTSLKDQKRDLENCPDPNLILKIQE